VRYDGWRNANRSGRTGRATFWTVTAYDAHDRQVYATLPLESAAPVRHWHDYWSGKRFVRRVELAELTTDIAERFITFDYLPAPGQPGRHP